MRVMRVMIKVMRVMGGESEGESVVAVVVMVKVGPNLIRCLKVFLLSRLLLLPVLVPGC